MRPPVVKLDRVALREAVINSIIHNDYSYEGVPKFELFADRLEITSTGSIPQGMCEAEFFEGYSIPRNKELMRFYPFPPLLFPSRLRLIRQNPRLSG